MTSSSRSSALSAVPAPEHGSGEFSKLMRHRESWNQWAYHIASSKATRGEGQELEEIEQNETWFQFAIFGELKNIIPEKEVDAWCIF